MYSLLTNTQKTHTDKYGFDVDGNKYNKITIHQFNTQKNADMNNPNYEDEDNAETAIQCREEINYLLSLFCTLPSVLSLPLMPSVIYYNLSVTNNLN